MSWTTRRPQSGGSGGSKTLNAAAAKVATNIVKCKDGHGELLVSNYWRGEMMKSVKYKDYDIEVKSRKMPSGLWRSSAQTKYSSGLISITALPPGLKGFDSELQAEKKSIAAIKEWIDQKTRT